MKRVLLLIFIITLSCSENRNIETFLSKKIERYSMETDTVYNPNSTEIKHIERTFYKKHQTSYTPYITISNIVGTDKFTLTGLKYDGDKLEGSIILEFKKKGSFDKMLNVIDTIIKYNGKKLNYDLEDGYVFSSTDRAVISETFNIYSTKESILFSVSKSERDSIHSVYARYKEELKANN